MVTCNNTGYTQKNGAVSKLTRNLFLTLHGHNVHCQQQQLSKFLMRYQQFASHAYCGPVSKMASQQEKAFCVLHFEVSRSVITVQCEFCARFRRFHTLWPQKTNNASLLFHGASWQWSGRVVCCMAYCIGSNCLIVTTPIWHIAKEPFCVPK